MQTVKVRVKKLANGGPAPKPLYQQDKYTGLDAYAIPMIYKEKEEEDKIKNTEDIVDRDEANVELEKGEVVSRGLVSASENSDYPQLTKVGGKSHSKGGSPAILETGDFVFSEYLKMSPEELKALGGSGKDISYAKFASKYIKPLNKAVHDLNTSDDRLDKETAAMIVDGVKTKLSKVAMLQEAGKGFDDEVEFEAKSGGLYKMQEAGKFKKREGRNYRITTADQAPQRAPDFADNEFDYFDTFGTSSRSKGSRNFNLAFSQARKQGLQSFTWNGKKYTTEIFKKSPDDFVAVPNQMIDDGMTIYPQEYEFDNPSQGTQTPKTETLKIQTVGSGLPKSDNQIGAGDPGQIFSKNFGDTGYGTMEMVDIISPFVQPINRYAPIKKRVEAQQINFRPVDFEAQRQSVKGQVATAQQMNNLISPSSSISSARNAQLLGQSLDPINQSFMQEFNTNQLGYQQAEAQNAQMRQQANQINMGMADDYDTKYAQMNENFDARKSQRFRQFLQKWYSADNNRQMRNLMNYLMTDYEIGPNQEIKRVAQSSDQKMARITGSSGSGQSSGNLYEAAKESLIALGIKEPTEDDIKKEALRMRNQNLNINNQRSFEMLPNVLMQYLNNQNLRRNMNLGNGASDFE